MRLYSAYRGVANKGIGNSVGATNLYGDQYLKADAELWHTPQLPEQMRPWLTLVPGASVQEGWSAFSIGSWQMLARLCPFGVDAGGRRTYYSHLRAWSDEDWSRHPEWDWGAYLGISDAFDPPWQNADEYLPASPPAPDHDGAFADWKQVLSGESVCAIALLAHLERTVRNNTILAWIVEPEDFTRGSAAMRLVAFARAALPWSVKRKVRLRINVHDLSRFLESVEEPHLVVLKPDQESAFRQIRSHATILDRQGNLRSGEAAATDYAQAAVGRAREYPEVLLRFSAEVEKHLGGVDRTSNFKAIVRSIYDVILARKYEQIDRLMVSLYKASAKNISDVFPWDRILTVADWGKVSLGVLTQLCCESAPTDDSRDFRKYARNELRQRDLLLNDVASLWKPDLVGAHFLLELCEDELVKLEVVGQCLPELSAKDVAELVLDQRFAPVFLRAVRVPPHHWVDLAEHPRREDLFSVISDAGSHRSSPVQPSNGTSWRQIQELLVLHLADDPKTSEKTGSKVSSMGEPPRDRLDLSLAEIELLGRFANSRPAAKRRVDALLKQNLASEERREVTRLVLRQNRSGLRSVFSIPLEWYPSIRDLILREPWYFESLETDRLLTLLGNDPMPREVAAVIDRRSDSAANQTSTLVKFGRWLEWRKMSQVPAIQRRSWAIHWLRIAAKQPFLEDWKQALRDLGKIDREVLQPFLTPENTGQPGFPSIRGFEQEQVKDCAALASDFSSLGVLVDLASRDTSARPGVCKIIEAASSFCAGLPSNVLLIFTSHQFEPPALKFDDWRRIALKAGPCSQRFFQTYADGLLWEFDANRRLEPIRPNYGEVKHNSSKILEEACRQVDDILANRRFIAEGISAIVPSLPIIDDPDAEAAATRYREAGFDKLAEKLAGLPSPERIVRHMCEGRFEEQEWADVAAAKFTGHGSDSMGAIVRAIAVLDEGKFQPLESHGWEVLKTALRHNPQLLTLKGTTAAPLPCLVLAIAVARESTGSLAETILQIARSYYQTPTSHLSRAWYKAFFEAMAAGKRRGRFRFAEDDVHGAVSVLNRYVMQDLAHEERIRFFAAWTSWVSSFSAKAL